MNMKKERTKNFERIYDEDGPISFKNISQKPLYIRISKNKPVVIHSKKEQSIALMIKPDETYTWQK